MDKVPLDIILHKKSRVLEIVFASGEHFHLPFQFLRIYSPSADMRGKVIVGKENIDIVAIEPVGNYGIKPIFDDGHCTGIFSWVRLYELGRQTVIETVIAAAGE